MEHIQEAQFSATHNWQALRNPKTGAAKRAWLAGFLLYKPEGLSSVPRTYIKTPGPERYGDNPLLPDRIQGLIRRMEHNICCKPGQELCAGRLWALGKRTTTVLINKHHQMPSKYSFISMGECSSCPLSEEFLTPREVVDTETGTSHSAQDKGW